MAYAQIADYNGEINVTIFPKPWNELKDKLEENTITALKGKIKKDSYKNEYVFYADTSPGLERLKAKTGKKTTNTEKIQKPCRELHIRLQRTAADNEDALYILKNILEKNPGSSPVYFHVPEQRGETVIHTTSQINTGAAATELHQCTGIAEIWEK